MIMSRDASCQISEFKVYQYNLFTLLIISFLKFYSANGSSKEKEVKKPLNPTGQDRERLLSRACSSYWHMMQDCPHSWKRMKGKVLLAGVEDSEEESFFTMINKDRM